jgi:ATP-dependent helicase/nuclease subunit B
LGIVVDYKRTRDKRLKLQEVYHGISLQLLGYLLLLGERGETLGGRRIVPVGAFYVSLMQKYMNVDHPDDLTAEVAAGLRVKPRGVLDAGRIEVLDSNAPSEGRSNIFNIFRKKDGSLGHLNSIDAAEPAGFQRLLSHVGAKMGQLADGVLDGNVSVAPYRLGHFSPCQWCEMQSVCRFEFATGDMRRLDEMNRTQVLARIEGGS